MAALVNRLKVSALTSGSRIGAVRLMASKTHAAPNGKANLSRMYSSPHTHGAQLMWFPKGMWVDTQRATGNFKMESDGSFSTKVDGVQVRVGWPASPSLDLVLKPPVEQHLFEESPTAKVPEISGHH